jgi:(p)ppGpp synthase/HD superfamily hydrolase
LQLDSFEIEKAYKFAELAHKGAFRRLEKKPYIVHPDRVARSVLLYSRDQDLVITALLHDVIEDSKFTRHNIERLFGKRVASLVNELTSDPLQLEKMGKTAYLSHKLNSISDDALLIKLLDRKDNIGDLALGDTEFVKRYTKSTLKFLDSLKSRKLTKAHQSIIKEILKLL